MIEKSIFPAWMLENLTSRLFFFFFNPGEITIHKACLYSDQRDGKKVACHI